VCVESVDVEGIREVMKKVLMPTSNDFGFMFLSGSL
jgi:hypothetical protein